MMDDHDVRESEEVVKSEYVVYRRRGMAAHVPEYHSLCSQLVDERHATSCKTYRLDGAPRTALGCNVGLRR